MFYPYQYFRHVGKSKKILEIIFFFLPLSVFPSNSFCCVVDLVEKVYFENFFFEICSTLIISISVMLGSRSSRKKKFFKKKIEIFFTLISISVDMLGSRKRNFEFFFLSTLISISVDMLGSRSSRKKKNLRFLLLLSVFPLICWPDPKDCHYYCLRLFVCLSSTLLAPKSFSRI